MSVRKVCRGSECLAKPTFVAFGSLVTLASFARQSNDEDGRGRTNVTRQELLHGAVMLFGACCLGG